ncbi:MAG: tRNA pseudouridine(38-40) synthase TruA [Acutalibacteraceae bacterium]|nr:tRNA pseudouridine(38-40) synthase TruA [Clostridiales bacterium]
MRNLLLTLKFDGRNYHGWQVQNNAITVQQILQDGIEKVLKKREPVIGCSRTDSGVHANFYCCGVITKNIIPCEKFALALNANLPYDIVVLDCREMPQNFHARYSCTSKEYVYKIYNAKVRDPFLYGYTLHYKYLLDAKMLDKQAKDFIGTYDYKGFCGKKSDVEETVRTVKNASVERCGDMVTFTVEADGFLYNMVRIMVGTLLGIAQGRIEQGSVKDIILSKERTRAGVTVSPYGLYLNKVFYGSEDGAKENNK